MPSNSEYHGYEIPDDGEQNWGDPLQRTLQALDRDTVIRRATASDITSETPTNDALAIARDSERFFIGTDTAWLELDTLGPDPEVTSLDADENLSLPVRTDNSTVTAEDGQVWFNDGSGPDAAGVYYYDANSQIVGPVGEGAGSAPASLSGLTIDTTKDFGGESLTGLGHDEVDVPRTFDLITDDFERASLGSDYVGDVSDAQIQSAVALEGSRSLEIATTSSGSSFVGAIREDTVELGDSFKSFIQLTDADDIGILSILATEPASAVSNSTGVDIQVRAFDDELRLREVVSGPTTDTITTADISSNLNERLALAVTVGEDREITVTLLDATDSELGSVSATVGSEVPQSGATQFKAANPNTATNQYFDGPFIDRRLGEETRERQRGATETSKLQTRGGVGSGPRILPENRAAEIMADAGITSALAAGTEVSYGLQLNGRKMLTIFGEADGSGGLQNPAVDFESRQLKDVSNSQTADSMTADPEADTEDGFIEIELGGTAYQIPVYQA